MTSQHQGSEMVEDGTCCGYCGRASGWRVDFFVCCACAREVYAIARADTYLDASGVYQHGRSDDTISAIIARAQAALSPPPQ